MEESKFTIPLIDISKFLHGSPTERVETAKAILNGFQTAGFIYLSNLPITPEKVDTAFSTSAQFFAKPLQTKELYNWTTPEANRGYSGPGREKVSDIKDRDEVMKLKDAVPDLKESFEIGRDDEPGQPNQWPGDAGEVDAQWKSFMLSFWQECKELHIEVMRAIAVGMGLPETWFEGYLDIGDNTLRLLHYPAVKKEVFDRNKMQVRAGEHTDYGSVTLLFQDERGGLQVQAPDGTFVNATPIKGTCVVNAGDLLARWSNDTIKSTLHRVVEPPAKQEEYPARYSIAYFCNPNFDSTIETIPGTYGLEMAKEKKYEKIGAGEYIIGRLASTY